MKRYYIVPADAMPAGQDLGEYHYIDLDSVPGGAGTGHRVLVLCDERKQPLPGWEELPHLLDAETKFSDAKHAAHHAQLKHLGVKPAHGGFAMARLLGDIHGRFK